MTLTVVEQSRAPIEAITLAPSGDVLGELRRVARREHGSELHGSFLELLIELRQEKLAGTGACRARTA